MATPEPRPWQEALIGAAFAVVGMAVVEMLIVSGLRPLGPIGWPLGASLIAAAFYGLYGFLGATAACVVYYLVNTLYPGRFPDFFASPTPTIAWVAATALFGSVVVALRSRLTEARTAAELSEALRESERRFRQLTQLSTDWAWEQDASFRFTFISPTARERGLFDPKKLIGKTRWELPAVNMTEEDWERHRNVLRAHQPFRDFVVAHLDPAGNRRWTSVSGEPMFDARGAFTGYRGVTHDITRQKSAEEALRESEQRLRLVADNVPALIGYVDTGERFRLVNRAYEEWFGLSAGDAVGRSVREVWGEERYRVIAPNMARALKGERISFEYSFVDRHGQERHVLAQYVPEVGDDGLVHGFFVLGTDVSALAEIRRTLHLANERLGHALEGSSAALWDADLRAGRVYLSEAWGQIRGTPPGETVTTFAELYATAHPDDVPGIRKASRDAVKGINPLYSVEHRVRTVSGDWRWILSRGRVTQRDAEGRALRMIGTNLDITDRKRMEEKLQSAAQTDLLTGLANRVLLMDRVRLAMARAVRSGAQCALLYLDLDRFKEVNDSLGHAAGDALLKDFAARLRVCVRQTDTVARVGGDEFVVLLEDLKDEADARRIAEKILELTRGPLRLEGREIAVTTSIGLAPARGDADEAAWLARADAALYSAKNAGRDTIGSAA